MNEKLVKILTEARHNPNLKQKLIDTKSAKDPMQAFCEVATEAGYPMTVGELFQIGEEYAANLLKCCNGGAVYPIDDWGDWYEDFFAALK